MFSGGALNSGAGCGAGAMAVGSGGGALAAGATKYMIGPGGNWGDQPIALQVLTHNATLKNLYVALGTAPSGAESVVFTVVRSTDNGATFSNTTLTATISGANKNASDTVNTVSVSAGDQLAIKAVASGGGGQAAANAVGGFESQ